MSSRSVRRLSRPASVVGVRSWSVTVLAVSALGALIVSAKLLISLGLTNAGAVELLGTTLPMSDGGAAVRYDPPPNDRTGRAARAEARFREAIRWSPGSGVAHLGLGRALIAQGRYDEAASTLETGVGLTGVGRGGYDAGNAQMYAGNRQRALELWSAAAGDSDGLYRLALAIFVQSSWEQHHPDRWDDAIAILEDVLASTTLSEGDRLRFGLQLVTMYQHIGNLARAEQATRALLDRDPRAGDMRSMLAWILLSQERHDAAAREAERSLQDQAGWRAHYVLGQVHVGRCALDAAIRHFSAGLRFSADEYRFSYQWIALGDAYWEQGLEEEALGAWDTYIALQPHDLAMANWRARGLVGDLPRKCGAP